MLRQKIASGQAGPGVDCLWARRKNERMCVGFRLGETEGVEERTEGGESGRATLNIAGDCVSARELRERRVMLLALSRG